MLELTGIVKDECTLGTYFESGYTIVYIERIAARLKRPLLKNVNALTTKFFRI
jgi:hypothetical protein